MPASNRARDKYGLRPTRAVRATRADVRLWRSLHADDNNMMYPLPTRDGALWKQLTETNAHIVVDGVGCVIGAFTLRIIAPGIASFGVVVSKELRGSGCGVRVMELCESVARNLGIRTLRADVYTDNAPAQGLLKSQGFREFLWLEKNLQ